MAGPVLPPALPCQGGDGINMVGPAQPLPRKNFLIYRLSMLPVGPPRRNQLTEGCTRFLQRRSTRGERTPRALVARGALERIRHSATTAATHHASQGCHWDKVCAHKDLTVR